MYIHMQGRVANILVDVTNKLEIINKDLEKILPQVTIREVSSFGNSGHVVLSKSLLDKKVGVIVLDDNKIERRLRK
jgi:putative transposon-encoded protein